MKVRVLICNRIRMYAEGLLRLLEEGGGDIRARVVDREEIVSGNGDMDADVVIADAPNFPLLAGRARHILLVWDGRNQQDLPPFGDLKEMVEQGLAGILDAGTDPALLRKAVFKVHEGELWMDHTIIRDFLLSAEKSGNGGDIQLSKRESEIMALICEGHSNREIAERLSITEPTVKSHCNHLFKKFGVSSRLQLALSAVGDDSHLASHTECSEKSRPRPGDA